MNGNNDSEEGKTLAQNIAISLYVLVVIKNIQLFLMGQDCFAYETCGQNHGSLSKDSVVLVGSLHLLLCHSRWSTKRSELPSCASSKQTSVSIWSTVCGTTYFLHH